MGLKKRKQIKMKQKLKRHKKRLKLIQKGENPEDYYFGRFYVGPHGSEE